MRSCEELPRPLCPQLGLRLSTHVPDSRDALSTPQSETSVESPLFSDASFETDATDYSSEDLGDVLMRIPDRALCEEKMLATPNGRVWAARREDLTRFGGTVSLGADSKGERYWSPSMVHAGENMLREECATEPSFAATVYGSDWDGTVNEPEPRKMQVWPVLSIRSCPSELRGIVDESVQIADTFEQPTPPKLEQHIPNHLLPDVLLVFDAANHCGRQVSERQPAIQKYFRVFPPCSSPKSTAKLVIPCESAFAGKAKHAKIFSAALTLDDRFAVLDADEATVSVIAKIPFCRTEDRKMLHEEAYMYNSMRERAPHLSEHWTGFNAIEEACDFELDDEGREVFCNTADVRVPATAVVPQFYGYYAPEEKGSTAREILLLEDCGTQIEAAALSDSDKMTCYTFLHRLFRAGIKQNSFHLRNIVMQPGPLTLPPQLRSSETPSFRMIDFGRGEWVKPGDKLECWDRTEARDEIYGSVIYGPNLH
ncbi:hypothetical protein MKEN_00618500 [Mycena kentingensis (nom. inval.)]|nr:hypothetical protein MKEN_00618500 [Mycena kentingensis (nom. inval.)]